MATNQPSLVHAAEQHKVTYEMRPVLFGLFKYWREVKAEYAATFIHIQTSEEKPHIFLNGEEINY